MATLKEPPPVPTMAQLFDRNGNAFDVHMAAGSHTPGAKHRWRPSPRRFRWTRVAVFTRDGWRCGDCGLEFPHDDPWVASGERHPRLEIAPQRVLVRRPRDEPDLYEWRPRFEGLSLHHRVGYADGGEFKVANLRALCGDCNTRRGPHGDY